MSNNQNSLEDYVLVTDIKILFDDTFTPSKRLKVIVDTKSQDVKWESTAGRNSHWKLNPTVSLWPGSFLVVQPYRHRTLSTFSKSKGEQVKFDGRDLLELCRNQTEDKVEYRKGIAGFEITLCISLVKLSASIPDLTDVKSSLDIFGDASKLLGNAMDTIKTVAKIHPVAETAVMVVSSVYTLLQHEQEFITHLRDLGTEIRDILASLVEVRDRARLVLLQDSIISILKTITEAAELIRGFLQRNRAARVWTSQYSTMSKDLKEKLRHQRQNFNEAITVQILVNTMSAEDEKVLSSLKPAIREPYVGGCMPGTRLDILQIINTWVDDHDAPNILWLRASPGAGKSVIASTMVAQLREELRLGSDFFFKTGHVSLGDPISVWRTVCADLTQINPSFQKAILGILKARTVDPERTDIEAQFKHLIQEPLQRSQWQSSNRHPVIVLDALDECLRGPHRKAFLKTLHSWSQLPSSLKLLVTGRDEVDIAATLRDICQSEVLHTGELVTPQTSSDIRHFLQTSFTEIANDYHDTLSPTWPGISVIENLTKRAAGLFIWADTVAKFIASGDPSKRLKLVLDDQLGKAKSNIDGLYLRILRTSLDDADLDSFKDIVGTIIVTREHLSVASLRGLLCLPEDDTSIPFILNALRPVISVSSSDGWLRIHHQSFADFLTSPQRCPQEYLIERGECSRVVALACLKRMNSVDRGLEFNICGLETSSLLNEDVSDLPKRIEKRILPDLSYACRFWASHIHETTQNNPDLLVEQIEALLCNHLPHWIEVLSLLRSTPAASTALLTAARWLKHIKPELSAKAIDGSRFVVTFQYPITHSAPHIYISALPFSPRSSWVSKQYISSYQNTLRVAVGLEGHWPPRLNVINPHNEAVSCISLSSDDLRIASCSGDKSVCVWDADTGQLVSGPFEGHTGAVTSVAFSPDGKQIASGSLDHTVCVWDAESGIIVAGPFKGHTEGVMAVAFSPEGGRIASASQDKTLMVWDAKTGAPISGPFIGHTFRVYCIAFSPNGLKIASGAGDDSVRVWDPTNGTSVAGPCSGHAGIVSSVAFSRNNKHVVSAAFDGKIHIWDAESGTAIRTPLEAHGGSVSSVVFSLDGQRLVSCGDHKIHVWGTRNWEIVAGPFNNHPGIVTSVAFSSDGRRIVSGSWDKTISVWDGEYREVIGVAELFGWMSVFKLMSMAFSQDRRRMVTGTRDNLVHVWDLEDLSTTPLRTYEGHTNQVSSVAFSSDGKFFVSGSLDKTIRIWNIKDGIMAPVLLEEHNSPITSVALSGDGARVMSGSSDGGVRIQDATSGVVLCEPSRLNGAFAIPSAFSPDGKWIASGCSDNKIRVWDTVDGALVREPFEGHSGPIFSIAFSLDGRQVVSGSADGSIFLWNANNGSILAGPLRGHHGSIISVAFMMEGAQIFSFSEDKTLRVWDVKMLLVEEKGLRSGFSEVSEIDEHGWMRDNDGSLLFWVPPSHRAGLLRPMNIAIHGARETKLDLDKFVYGSSWAACKT